MTLYIWEFLFLAYNYVLLYTYICIAFYVSCSVPHSRNYSLFSLRSHFICYSRNFSLYSPLPFLFSYNAVPYSSNSPSNLPFQLPFPSLPHPLAPTPPPLPPPMVYQNLPSISYSPPLPHPTSNEQQISNQSQPLESVGLTGHATDCRRLWLHGHTNSKCGHQLKKQNLRQQDETTKWQHPIQLRPTPSIYKIDDTSCVAIPKPQPLNSLLIQENATWCHQHVTI